MPQELETVCPSNEDAGLGAAIERVAAQVLETMFFTEVVVSECEHRWLRSAFSARVAFEGSHFGEIVLSASLAAARSISSGFLGVDPEEMTAAQRDQVILELANITCGAVLSNLWPESRLSLSSPELAGEHLPEGAVHRCFALPEGKLAVSIRLRSSAGPA